MAGWRDAPIVGQAEMPAPAWQSTPVVQRRAGPQSEVTPTIEPIPGATYVTPPTAFEKGTQRAAETMQGVNLGLGNMLSLGAMDEALGLADVAAGRGTLEETTRRRQRQLSEADPLGRGIGEGLGIVATAPMGAATTLGRSLGQSGILGTILGYNMAQGTPEERLPSAAVGGVAGVGGDLFGRAIARIASPVSNYAVRTLREMGVTPTPGQILGPKATATEQRMMSAPLLGDVVAGGRRRAAREWNRATVNDALRPAGLTVPATATNGRQIIRAADDLLGSEYDRILDPARVSLDDQFIADLRSVSDAATENLDEVGVNEIRRQAARLSSLAEMNNGVISGRTLQEARTRIRNEARRFSRSQDPFQQRTGEVLEAMDDTFTGLLQRNLPPEDGARIGGLDNAYRRFVRVQEASTVAPTKGGEFTPGQFLSTIKRQAEGVRNRQFSRGESVGQAQAEAAQEILGNTIPDSGTAGRGLEVLAGAGGLYGMTHHPVATGLAAGTLALPMPAYTPQGQRLLATLLAGRQGPGYRAAAETLRNISPGIGMGAAVAAPPLLEGLMRKGR